MTTVARLMDLPKRARVVLDIKGLLTHSYFSGKDPEQVKGRDGKSFNTAGYGLEVFFDRYLSPILNGFAPIDIIAVWDGGNNFRKAIYPDYKKHRLADKEKEDPTQAEQLKLLLDVAKRLLANLGAINMYVDGVEADDVIALLATTMQCPLMIYTVDADLLQLTSPTVAVSHRDEFSGEDAHKGIEHRYLALHKSIVGDSSDGYPGVKGLGPAAYNKLIDLYGEEIQDELLRIIKEKAFDELHEAAEENDCRLLRMLYEARQDWQKMYILAQLHPEICYGMSKGKKVEPIFYTRVPSKEKVYALLESVQCRHLQSLVAKFLGGFILADDTCFDAQAETMVDMIKAGPIVAFDFETYDPIKHQPFVQALSEKAKENGFVDVLSSIPTGGSFTFGENLQHTVYIPELHKDTANVTDGVASVLRYLVDDWNGPICAHNAAFEEQVAKQNYHIQFDRLVDTMIMSSYVDENRRAGLKGLSAICLGHTQQGYKELLDACGAEDMRGVSGSEVLSYGCDDALMTAHLWKLFDLVMSIEKSIDFFLENETTTVHVLNRAFETGVNIDFNRMEELREADSNTVVEGMAKVRHLLQEHCMEESEKAANAFFEADHEALRVKMLNKAHKNEWGKDRVKAELEKVRLEYIDATAYKPLVVIKRGVEFNPTPSQLQKVIAKLKFVDQEGVPVELKKLTGSSITDFLLQTEGMMSEEAQIFRDLFATSAKFFSKAKDHAEMLQPLTEFCSSILARDAAEETIGDELNFGSPKQMAALFYLKLGLPVRERTKKTKGSFRDVEGLPGSPSTDETAVNAALLFDCPEGDWRRELLKTMLDVKESMTRESLYYKPYPLWVHPKDGVIHPQIRNCGTVTRRPSGASPNILQVSKGQTRSIFIPRYSGHVIISNDFSGQELRITGSESKDATLIDCYTGGGTYTDADGMIHPVTRDVHSVTGCAFAFDVLGKSLNKDIIDLCPKDSRGFVDYDFFRKVYKTEVKKHGLIDVLGDFTQDVVSVFERVRNMAKVVNFLIIYGGNHMTLARKLGISEEFAQRLMDLVFKSYARLEPWQKETIEFAEKHGYVQTAYGIRRHVTDAIVSRDSGTKSRMERQSVNATVQACAAEILKVVMREIYVKKLMEETKSVLIAPVYDEIVASVPAHYAVEYTHRLQAIMNVTPPGHAIPMMAEASIGRNWADQEELGDNPSPKSIEACIERAFS